MNNPLDYEPHPLCIQACREVQEMLARREDWQEEIARGKMFGVLIVENVKTDTDVPKWGYLAAYSGQIGGRSDWEDFVPAVFDYLQPETERSEERFSRNPETDLVCRLLLEKKKNN